VIRIVLALIEMPLVMKYFGYLWNRLDDIPEIFQRAFDGCKADVGD
jgi:hypothetical protein